VASMIPVINIFIMPIAVAGGTLFWINELRQDAITSRVIDHDRL
jgi:CysZ protein